MTDPAALWADALAAVRIVMRFGGGLIVRARAGPVRDRLLAGVGGPPAMLRITAESDPSLLAGGTDLFASLAAGRWVERPALAARLGARVLVVAGAERIGAELAGLLARMIDAGELPRLVLLDEGVEEAVPAIVADRAAMRVDLAALSIRDAVGAEAAGTGDADAVVMATGAATAFCEAAATLGIASLRAPLQAIAVARAAAALAGRTAVDTDDLARAARLVLAPRAAQRPEAATEETGRSPPQHADAAAEGGEAETDDRTSVLDAVRAVLPDGLLEGPASRPTGPGTAGGSAAAARGTGERGRRGRPKRGRPERRGRLDLAATLLAAAPFQRARGRAPGARPVFARDDLRVRPPVPARRAVTLFVVDASGSAALARLAEVKGAVERLLADSYVRRDEVALLAFRGKGAELVLPPTRSLARARRELAALPGGGATPLAAGLAAGVAQAVRCRAAGRAPLLVLLSDGGANVARDGSTGRRQARADADAVARMAAGTGLPALVIDSSPRGSAEMRATAEAMRARYLALPRIDGAAIGAAVAEARPR